MSNSSHAYIVHTGAETVTSRFVAELLSKMLCSSQSGRPCGTCVHCDKIARGIHPDVTVIARLEGKKEIQVEQIREAVFGARLLPNEAERRVIVIDRADEMNANAQNALLKLLEEPPSHIALLLLTEKPGALLPTVRSRCRIEDAGGEPVEVPEDIKALAGRYFELALRGGEALVEFSFELEKTDKRDFALLLSEVRRIAAGRLRLALENGGGGEISKKAHGIIEASKKAEEYLRRNVSVMHISAMLCAV